jgi:hypothetical protein
LIPARAAGPAAERAQICQHRCAGCGAGAVSGKASEPDMPASCEWSNRVGVLDATVRRADF